MHQGSCHCGAVQLTLPATPKVATACNCALCRRIGGPWVYFEYGTVTISGHPDHTTGYIQGDRTLRTVRCTNCGCVTHWEPLAPQPGAMHGVNLANFDPALVASVPARRFDGADTWQFFDALPAAVHQGFLPGCIGRIAQLHAAHYAAAHSFGPAFEAKVARELADFCQASQPGRDGLWLALHQGQVEGSIAIDGSQAHTEGAHLRWFITTNAVRGQGVGKRLLQHALDFVDACGYPSTYLWTFAGLDAARHLYESQGFRLVLERPGRQWGALVQEQRFERSAA